MFPYEFSLMAASVLLEGFKLKKTKEKNISILVQGKWLRQSKRFYLVCLDYLC